ncbi:hypothetical protein HK414_17470 [Ramlibacter terrae]|uniref:Uncharacterized protein n=1 Tax=Ramlibacter terrae TaxID=2732511 RepID=A0ABX6NZG4_9BURK|nr:hypothetical protein HK414_17470 [Ramlibacter terrae]
MVSAYVASRDEVHALTGEDSGSSYRAQARVPSLPANVLAGTPQRAQ